MIAVYKSKYGKIVKQCPGVSEYWHKGKLIARGSSVSSSDPREAPTKADWAFCVSLRPQKGQVYWRVRYAYVGSDGPVVEYFDTEADALRFYNNEKIANSPERVVITDPNKIELIERYKYGGGDA
jgi:hypothetical protein